MLATTAQTTHAIFWVVVFQIWKIDPWLDAATHWCLCDVRVGADVSLSVSLYPPFPISIDCSENTKRVGHAAHANQYDNTLSRDKHSVFHRVNKHDECTIYSICSLFLCINYFHLFRSATSVPLAGIHHFRNWCCEWSYENKTYFYMDGDRPWPWKAVEKANNRLQ